MRNRKEARSNSNAINPAKIAELNKAMTALNAQVFVAHIQLKKDPQLFHDSSHIETVKNNIIKHFVEVKNKISEIQQFDGQFENICFNTFYENISKLRQVLMNRHETLEILQAASEMYQAINSKCITNLRMLYVLNMWISLNQKLASWTIVEDLETQQQTSSSAYTELLSKIKEYDKKEQYYINLLVLLEPSNKTEFITSFNTYHYSILGSIALRENKIKKAEKYLALADNFYTGLDATHPNFAAFSTLLIKLYQELSEYYDKKKDYYDVIYCLESILDIFESLKFSVKHYPHERNNVCNSNITNFGGFTDFKQSDIKNMLERTYRRLIEFNVDQLQKLFKSNCLTVDFKKETSNHHFYLNFETNEFAKQFASIFADCIEMSAFKDNSMKIDMLSFNFGDLSTQVDKYNQSHNKSSTNIDVEDKKVIAQEDDRKLKNECLPTFVEEKKLTAQEEKDLKRERHELSSQLRAETKASLEEKQKKNTLIKPSKEETKDTQGNQQSNQKKSALSNDRNIIWHNKEINLNNTALIELRGAKEPTCAYFDKGIFFQMPNAYIKKKTAAVGKRGLVLAVNSKKRQGYKPITGKEKKLKSYYPEYTWKLKVFGEQGAGKHSAIGKCVSKGTEKRTVDGNEQTVNWNLVKMDKYVARH